MGKVSVDLRSPELELPDIDELLEEAARKSGSAVLTIASSQHQIDTYYGQNYARQSAGSVFQREGIIDQSSQPTLY